MSVHKGTFMYDKLHKAQAHKDRALAHGFTAKLVRVRDGVFRGDFVQLYRVEIS